MLLRSSLLILAAVPFAAQAQEEAARLHRLFADQHAGLMREAPELATDEGYPGYNDRWSDRSPDAIAAQKKHTLEWRGRLTAIDRAKLGAGDQLNYDLFRWMLDTDIEESRFPVEFLAVDAMGDGVHSMVPQVLQNAPARTVKDYDDAIARLQKTPALVDQNIALLREGIRTGITQPRIVMRDVPAQVDAILNQAPADSVMLKSFSNFPATIAPADQDRLRRQAAALVDGTVYPAFRKWRAFLLNDYIPHCRETIALSAVPDGAAWYRANVKRQTTTDLTPEQIHAIGQAEVKRIHGEMDKTMQSADFHGAFTGFVHFLRNDPRFYYTRAGDLVTGYRDICKRIDEQLPAMFGKLPRAPYGVEPMDAYYAPSQTTAFYQPGAVDGSRPGIYRVNTYKLDQRPKYEMEVLSMHESVPGHHLQIALAHELTDVPDFRRALVPTAFVEGWGLYSESLGYEMGFYKDPYARFGQLSYDMWRACRLVVDTGMHALGWSRQQAIDFMEANTALTETNIVAEVDRYIAWPGQADADKIGQLQIRELRTRAEQRLGANFDVRQFHDEVLSAGALPLSVLDTRVNSWIEEQTHAGSRN